MRFEKLRKRARGLKQEVYALYLAARDPRTPWHARALASLVAAYALSPLDLIPDFVPVLGHLDDLVIVPLGVFIALKMVPPQVMADARKRSEELLSQGKPISLAGAVLVIAFWLLVIAVVLRSMAEIFRR